MSPAGCQQSHVPCWFPTPVDTWIITCTRYTHLGVCSLYINNHDSCYLLALSRKHLITCTHPNSRLSLSNHTFSTVSQLSHRHCTICTHLRSALSQQSHVPRFPPTPVDAWIITRTGYTHLSECSLSATICSSCSLSLPAASWLSCRERIISSLASSWSWSWLLFSSNCCKVTHHVNYLQSTVITETSEMHRKNIFTWTSFRVVTCAMVSFSLGILMFSPESTLGIIILYIT